MESRVNAAGTGAARTFRPSSTGSCSASVRSWVSMAQLAVQHDPKTNMVCRWRRQLRAGLFDQTKLLPVALVPMVQNYGRHTEWSTLYRQSDFTSIPLAGALYGIPARMDLCGARRATDVLGATAWAAIFDILERAVCLRFWPLVLWYFGTLGVCDWKAI